MQTDPRSTYGGGAILSATGKRPARRLYRDHRRRGDRPMRRATFQRFSNFGAELRRPFEVHEICYDCAEFYGPGHGEPGCDAWPAKKPMSTADRKHLRCLDFNRLPDVMPGPPTGQAFPPSLMRGRRTPRERKDEPAAPRPKKPDRVPKPVPTTRLGKRQCGCGRLLPPRRRFCDNCREARKREAKLRFEQRRPGRSHRGPDVPVEAA